MKYFVYYNDDWADNDGRGMEELKEKDKAIEFVEMRIKQGSKRKLSDYTLIYGETAPMKAVEVVTKIEA